jgi:hypothetical protein
VSSGASRRRADWQAQAARRAASANGAETAEDSILRALLSREPGALDAAIRIRASAELIDQDYLAYWVDALGLQEQWRKLG